MNFAYGDSFAGGYGGGPGGPGGPVGGYGGAEALSEDVAESNAAVIPVILAATALACTVAAISFRRWRQAASAHFFHVV